MKVTLIANLSANGQVLLAENPAHEAPQEALGYFVQQANLKGNLIIGRKTFEAFRQFPGGLKAIFPDIDVVIVSTSIAEIEGFKVVKNPEEALEYLSEKDFPEVIVGGGSGIYNSFLEKDLVTDICFNYIPLIIGDGGIIGINNLFLKFNKIEQTKLTDEIVQIHLS